MNVAREVAHVVREPVGEQRESCAARRFVSTRGLWGQTQWSRLSGGFRTFDLEYLERREKGGLLFCEEGGHCALDSNGSV